VDIRASEIQVGDSIAYNRPGIGWRRVEVRYVSRTKSGDPAVVIAPEDLSIKRRRGPKAPKVSIAYLDPNEQVALFARLSE
jgi:hypothetical protein